MQIKNIDIKFTAGNAFLFNNLRQIYAQSQKFRKRTILKFFGRNKQKCLNMIAKIVYGDVCLREMQLRLKYYNKLII